MRFGLRWAAAAMLLLSPAIAAAESAPDISGRWDTTFGPLDFTVTEVRDAQGAVTGRTAEAPYRDEGGTVAGDLNGSTLVGYWHEPESSIRCATQRRGTFYWGRIEFTFNPAANAYEGLWSYCDEAPARGWSGRRG